jgi:hypothetical protein
METHSFFTLDKRRKGRKPTCITALKLDLAEQQRDLPYGMDGLYVGLVEETPITHFKDLPEETSEKSGEPSSLHEAREKRRRHLS